MVRNTALCIFERLWNLMPDKCEVWDCSRKGVRGNENIDADGSIICDYCLSRRMNRNDV